MASAQSSFYARRGKRWLDCALAAGALLSLSPVMAAVALVVRRKHGSPVLLRQERTGLGGHSFEILKFRTMSEERDASGRLLPDERRVTPLGRLLRETSLDELPELINVLKGDMSLVGPRPLFHHYMQYYSAEQHRRHLVRPGLTGWAAINGRNAISWEERFLMDVWYVEHLSLWTDLRILMRTLEAVLARRDINPAEQATMPEFRGSTPANGVVRDYPQNGAGTHSDGKHPGSRAVSG